MSYVETLINDMALFHDAPCDVLKVIRSWGSGAFLPQAYNKPAGWTNGLMWFHIMEDLPAAQLSAADAARPWRVPGPYTGNLAQNTRTQARDLQLWFLLPNGTWFLHNHALRPGSYMPPISWGDEFGAKSNATWRSETDANGSGASIRDLGYGEYEDYVWHAFTSPRQPLPTSYLAIASAFYARLILDNPSGPDDRASARVLAAGAGDYYQDQATADGGTKIVGGNVSPMGYARLKYVTNDWQLFGFYSSNTLSQAALRANPPPFIGLSVLDGAGGGGITPPPPEPPAPPPFTPLSLPSRGTWFAQTSNGADSWATRGLTSLPDSKIRRRRGVKFWR